MKFYIVVSTLKTVSALVLAGSLFFSQLSFAQDPAPKTISCAVALSGKTQAFEITEKGSIKLSNQLGEKFIATAASQRNSTTGNRTELKRTVTVKSLSTALDRLSKTFSLKPRDAIQAGTKNVTVTQYLNSLKFKYNNKDLTVKIRFRKYGTILNNQINSMENVVLNPNMKEVSFFEFKIDHPDFDNSVLKPRGLLQDADIAAIGTPEFLKNFDQILSRAKALNSKNQDATSRTITDMLHVLKELHQEQVPLKKDSRTIYERTSYSLPVKNPANQQTYEIQITIDEGILLYSYAYDKTVDAYKSDEPLTVVELKIPVEMVDPTTKGFKPGMLNTIQELSSVQQFLNDLTAAQAPGFEANKGKQSLIKGLLEGSK